MQSGKAKTGLDWILEFDRETPRTIDPLMGYTSSADPLAQMKLKFESARCGGCLCRKARHCLPPGRAEGQQAARCFLFG
jgi:hypothetical protein